MVTRVENATTGRRQRMDADYRRVRGDPYNTNTDGEGNPTGTEFRSFTSNEAGAFVKKIVSVLAAAQLMVQVPYGAAQRAQRHRYDLKERFAEGCLAQADELLERTVAINLIDQLAWFGPNRGWITALGLLMNQEGGTTVAVARPWDPRNVYWEVGSSGLRWVCHRAARPASDVLAEYPRASLNVKEDDDPVTVYDFWTPTKNGVLTEDGMLKKWTVHGSPRVPVVIVPVPMQPQIWAPVGTTNFGQPDTLDDYGESVIATNRPLYDHINEVLSITLELMAKAREPGGLVFTDEEDTELSEHPSKSGGVHYLDREARYQEVAAPETTKDAIQLAGWVMGMLQRGGIPYSSYGAIDFPISGYAITQLNQQMMTVLKPQAKAIATAIRGVLDLWVDQFVTDGFNPMTIRGVGRNKDYMQVRVEPAMLLDLPPYKVELVAQLPQDDVARMAAAQSARAGKTPFLPDIWLMENFLHLPDSAQIAAQLKEQLAETASPAAAALTLARAAFERGELELARVYIDEYQRAMLISSMGAEQGGQGNPGVAPGMPPTALPFIAGRGAPIPPNAPTGEEGRFGLPRRRS